MFKNLRALLLLLPLPLLAQEKPTLSYYLPEISYNADIPTPAQYLGYEVGEWHVSHDQLVGYVRALAQSSPRISLREYGRSHEHRPLLCLTITAPENQGRLEEIRTQRRVLADPTRSSRLDPAAFPAVAYMGYSIHGNEASGSNAALLVAYYLAAGQTPELEAFLKNTIILLDPCFNPDGLQRFSTWVNSRRSQAPMPDPAHDEFNENWPSGRTNHYWFDLNRDWLVAQQPESRGRVAIFQDWLPNVLTDHHEMGTNSTFFFQPGVPSRVNPLTPARNQELTAQIAQFHAKILSENKVLFFSEENYDDFYYGKGSSYPDANGSIGILFEQASSRGSAQETDNGLLTFPYTIRNQVLTSLSTMQALATLRVDLNSYLRDFYKTGLDEARQSDTRAYVFGNAQTRLKDREFLQILLRHRIQVYPLAETVRVGEQLFEKNAAWIVPVEQPGFRLIQGIFERRTSFTDSIFYDISAWTLPDAFGLYWTPVERKTYQTRWQGQQVASLSTVGALPSMHFADKQPYAFVVGSQGYDLPRLLTALHRAKVRVQVATLAFEAEGQTYAPGSLLIPLDRQPLDAAAIYTVMQQSGAWDVRVHTLQNGLTSNGPDLGSSNFLTLREPKVALVTGRGAGAYETGEIWHLLDTRYGLTPLLLDQERFGRLDLDKYNVLVLADGNFSQLSVDKLRAFVNGGGTLIATGASLRWLKSAGLAKLEFRSVQADSTKGRRPYDKLSDDRRGRSLPGAIFELELDLTHPLCFGYSQPRLPVFQSEAIFMEPAKNPYATPAVFSEKPLLAGYLHAQYQKPVSGAGAILVAGGGAGRIICFSGNPNFRAFWYGTNRLFANAVFFGNLISGSGVER